tara:strand:- start:306 stop:440 length:135 start_codon:yes stop_codon:yes gene_type:complete
MEYMYAPVQTRRPNLEINCRRVGKKSILSFEKEEKEIEEERQKI